MRVVIAANKERGLQCLLSLSSAGHTLAAVVIHPGGAASANRIVSVARDMNLPLFDYRDINDDAAISQLGELKPDLIALAGYGQIVRERFLSLARLGCINLHAGKLPEYRGSSPMNWALINGESSYTLSIIKVDCGVDSGDVLAEQTFPIGPDDTISDLQRAADSVFPKMLVDVVKQIEVGTANGRPQDSSRAGYYPLRFPEDGMIVWDLLTAEQVNNRIRALTAPYPGAYTFWSARRVQLWKSRLSRRLFFGEPGRIYECTTRGFLVCAMDRCLWIEEATLDKADARKQIKRYDRFVSVRDAVAHWAATRSE